MKKYNQVISIEVSVDAIAERFQDILSEDYQHRDILAEAIIAPMVSNQQYGNLGFLCNALSGFKNELDFQEGDFIDCDDTCRRYYELTDKDTIKKTSGNWSKIGSAKVLEVDPYKLSNQIKVEFYIVNETKDLKLEAEEKWVDKKNCTKVDSEDTYYSMEVRYLAAIEKYVMTV